MLLGYLILVSLTIIVVIYALASLRHISDLNRSIVKIDTAVESLSDKMLSALLAQDVYEKRYLILRSRDMRTLFTKRGDEFQTWLGTLKKLNPPGYVSASAIETLYVKYMDLVGLEMRLVRSDRLEEASKLSDRDLKKVFDQLIGTLRKLSQSAQSAQGDKMLQISRTSDSAFVTTALLCLFSIVAGALAIVIVTHHIASSIYKLRVATEQISEGHFDYDPRIVSEDEIGGLARSFLDMGKRLRKLEEMYLDASPLTRLPGGIAIENVLNKRIESGQPLAFCVLDLDNFKAFNDRYGYANGSEVIKESARIIEYAVKKIGGENDFIGHVGGDDFVVITTPSLMREISEEVIAQFDKKIPLFYEEKDRRQGYIQGKTRQGVDMQFPIMTITIAIVTNERRRLTNHLEASEIAAELKDYAKMIPRSVFVVDKRKD
jgi:GGDEF domain-containing protein